MNILTKVSALARNDKELINEQDEILKSNGLENDNMSAYVMLINNRVFIYTTIAEGIQFLAMKEGADLVEFDNGNLGYIGYYGNVTYSKGNCLEIVGTWQSFQEAFGNKLTWEEAERRVGYSLDKTSNFDECLYFDELLAKVNEGR